MIFNFHHLYCLPRLPTPKHAAEPNVRVRIAGSIVQIEREGSGISSIVPIATAKRSAASGGDRPYTLYLFFNLTSAIDQKITSFVPLKILLLRLPWPVLSFS